MSPTLNDLSVKIRAFVRAVVDENPETAPDGVITRERAVVHCLQIAWADAVRAEWRKFVAEGPYQKEYEAAIMLMKEDRYEGGDKEPICCLPGRKASVCTVDEKECIAVDYTMAAVTPLSAIYLEKVLQAIRVAKHAGCQTSDDIEKLRTALQFYADPKSRETKGHPQIDADDTPLNHDGGEIARKALGNGNASGGQ
jgi:hypothetical protein